MSGRIERLRDIATNGYRTIDDDVRNLLLSAASELTAANERIKELDAELKHEEQRIADLMADVNRQGHELTAERTALERERLVSDKLVTAASALGVIGAGYCFCSRDRNPDKTIHEPECAELRAALTEVAAIRSKGETT